MIITSHAVFTASPQDSTPQRLAIAIEGDRICWVGSPDDIPPAYLGANTAVHDFEDALIVPGFHDAHMHFFHSALYDSPLAAHIVGKSEQDAVAKLADLAAHRKPGSWLLSQGWREYLWKPAKHPSKDSLDRAYPDRPVAMYSGDAHTLWLNSCALDVLGITNDSIPPKGGTYETDAYGNLTGIVREAAAMELMPRIVSSFSQEELFCAYRAFIKKLNAYGITSVCDMSLMARPGLDFVRDDLFAELEATGVLSLRVHMFPTLLADKSRYLAMQKAYRSPYLATKGFKQFFDGVSSQHTAWVKDPYTNAYFEGDCGRPTIAPEEMEHLVASALPLKAPVRIHTIGDQAIHEALRIFEAHPSSLSHCLEHLENFQEGDVERLAARNIIASVQPRHITLDPGGPERDLGDGRTRLMWPFRSLIDAGATLAFGTDSPVTDTNPFAVLYTAVTRRDAATCLPPDGWHPEERITMAEAIRAYTAGSAHATQRSDELGQIAPGMLADFSVIDRNLFEDAQHDPEAILKARTLATYVGGICVWNAEEQA